MAAAQRWRRAALAGLALCGALWATAPAQAHLMAAQKGTLNVVGDAAFLVLSVPVSALQGVDDDGDGALSVAELRAHTDAIRSQVQAGVQLHDAAGARPLQLVMLDVAQPENDPQAAVRHLVVMGRFALASAAATGADRSPPLALKFSLFGTGAGERQQDITITRRAESQWARFASGQETQALFPAAADLFALHLRLGAAHVLGGLDHLLFLLVVLAAGGGWRHLAGALTCFTAGHAITLVASVWGGLAVPPAIVEPAIAATIVGMALFDRWSHWRVRSVPGARPAGQALRLGLVFGCALIHGLGLASALGTLGVDSAHLGWTLAGFNAGIELAQLGVAGLFGLATLALRAAMGPAAPGLAARLASVVALAAGTLWFVERVVQIA